jgi:hypothetical protein
VARALWGAGAVVLARAPAPALAGDTRAPAVRQLARARRRVRVALVAMVAAIGALVLWDGGVGRAFLLIPACAAATQLLLLVGVLRFELYGTARRGERAGAERAGALAGDAAEMERLALLGELGATVAHEVRNPLTGIRSLAQRLGGDEPLAPERRARFAGLIVGEVDRLDRFVAGLLALARRDAPPAPSAEPARTDVAGAPRRPRGAGGRARGARRGAARVRHPPCPRWPRRAARSRRRCSTSRSTRWRTRPPAARSRSRRRGRGRHAPERARRRPRPAARRGRLALHPVRPRRARDRARPRRGAPRGRRARLAGARRGRAGRRRAVHRHRAGRPPAGRA